MPGSILMRSQGYPSFESPRWLFHDEEIWPTRSWQHSEAPFREAHITESRWLSPYGSAHWLTQTRHTSTQARTHQHSHTHTFHSVTFIERKQTRAVSFLSLGLVVSSLVVVTQKTSHTLELHPSSFNRSPGHANYPDCLFARENSSKTRHDVRNKKIIRRSTRQRQVACSIALPLIAFRKRTFHISTYPSVISFIFWTIAAREPDWNSVNQVSDAMKSHLFAMEVDFEESFLRCVETRFLTSVI